MQPPSYTIKAKVWLWSGKGAWHFVTVPTDVSAQIEEMFGYLKASWGSLRAKLTIGKTTWETSLFPDGKRNAYLIPIKAEIRRKENIKVDDAVEILIEVKT
jgi:hypothetical protein